MWTDICENITFPELRLRSVNNTLPAVNLGCRPRVPPAVVEPSWLCRTAILLVLLDMILNNLPAMNLEHTLCPLSCKNGPFTFGVTGFGGGGGGGQGSKAPFLTYFYTGAGEDRACWRLNRFHVS